MLSTAAIGPLVLVAEDHLLLAGLLTDIVAARGYTPAVAYTKLAALTLAREWSPALCIVDAMLPDQGDFPFVTVLRTEHGRSIRPIMLTSPGRVAGRVAGADATLSLPFHIVTLGRPPH